MESPVRTKNLSVSVPKDVHSIIEGIVSSFSPTLDLSKRGLEHLSEEIFKISHLKQLHLQRNELSIIPKDFFQLLPNLVWLDLRHNKIKAIPSGIGSHKNLKTLLMEKNPIKALPVELGNLMSLKALNLRNCPLEFPPPQVIHKGLPAILAFLRAWALEHSASLLQQEAVPMQKANSVKELSGARSEAEPPASAGEDSRGKDYHFPLVERLNLAGVTESSPDLSEDVSSDEGMKQFWQLRQEIVAAEKADILSNQLPLELQNRAKEHLHKPKYSFRPPLKKPYNSRKKTPSSKSIFPEIPSHETQIQIKKDEEKHLAALKELKEKQALIEQRKRRASGPGRSWTFGEPKAPGQPPDILRPQRGPAAPGDSSRSSAITLPTPLHRVTPRGDVPASSPQAPLLCLFGELPETLPAPWNLVFLPGGALDPALMTDRNRRREAPMPRVCRFRQPLSPSQARHTSAGPSISLSWDLGF
ncbi:leucine-rich repeat-containing protein 27 isoform X3 [Antechinus flavipes]|uniref:leucine-rich repeat-containing protein 27 isoform X3 n=1 Tax=Antechinus flavipes TaxID=38775 RepID=UPI0022360262|nr:leucine-rich repeat-containing protein 27 isoform X3 [Antechinus flavipes]